MYQLMKVYLQPGMEKYKVPSMSQRNKIIITNIGDGELGCNWYNKIEAFLWTSHFMSQWYEVSTKMLMWSLTAFKPVEYPEQRRMLILV